MTAWTLNEVGVVYGIKNGSHIYHHAKHISHILEEEIISRRNLSVLTTLKIKVAKNIAYNFNLEIF